MFEAIMAVIVLLGIIENLLDDAIAERVKGIDLDPIACLFDNFLIPVHEFLCAVDPEVVENRQ